MLTITRKQMKAGELVWLAVQESRMKDVHPGGMDIEEVITAAQSYASRVLPLTKKEVSDILNLPMMAFIRRKE